MRTRLFAGIAVVLLLAGLSASPSPSAAAAVGQKTVKECDAEYATNKAAIEAAKEKKADFIAACRATAVGQVTPIGGAAPAAAAPAKAAPTPPPPPKAETPAKAGTPSAAGQFTTEALAKAHCPSDTVVWENIKSKIYHFAKTKDYGTTKEGAYACEKEAMTAGFRAAKNETHP